ncbi:hypothetical protein [Lysobacter sp. 1R34A]|uniref:hypothetical protein n=1 Tax=Lysobacter sp. 1R34A TaxID=3445786 RepID=UPI003EEE2BE2
MTFGQSDAGGLVNRVSKWPGDNAVCEMEHQLAASIARNWASIWAVRSATR